MSRSSMTSESEPQQSRCSQARNAVPRTIFLALISRSICCRVMRSRRMQWARLIALPWQGGSLHHLRALPIAGTNKWVFLRIRPCCCACSKRRQFGYAAGVDDGAVDGDEEIGDQTIVNVEVMMKHSSTVSASVSTQPLSPPTEPVLGGRACVVGLCYSVFCILRSFAKKCTRCSASGSLCTDRASSTSAALRSLR